jgi:hypothetical protein
VTRFLAQQLTTGGSNGPTGDIQASVQHGVEGEAARRSQNAGEEDVQHRRGNRGHVGLPNQSAFIWNPMSIPAFIWVFICCRQRCRPHRAPASCEAATVINEFPPAAYLGSDCGMANRRKIPLSDQRHSHHRSIRRGRIFFVLRFLDGA